MLFWKLGVWAKSLTYLETVALPMGRLVQGFGVSLNEATRIFSQKTTIHDLMRMTQAFKRLMKWPKLWKLEAAPEIYGKK